MKATIQTSEIYTLITICEEMEKRVMAAELAIEADRQERWLATAKHKIGAIIKLAEEECLLGWKSYIDTCWNAAVAKAQWKLARSIGGDADLLHTLYCEIIVSQDAKVAALERLKHLNIYCHL